MSYSTQASNQVFQYITDHISSGIWKPGMKIDTEDQLCQTLSVSRAAVRQAIERLSSLSVLRKQQGSGTYVNGFDQVSLMGMLYYPPSRETMMTVLEFRRMFDSYNAELFVAHASQEELDAVEENYREMVTLKDDPQKFRSYESQFHHLLAIGTHNVIIQQISVLLTDLLTWHQAMQYDNIGPDNSILWHGRILEALQERNGELASLYTRIHIDNSIEYVEAHVNTEA